MIPKTKLGIHGPEVSRLALGLSDLGARGWSLQQRLSWLGQCLDLGYTTLEMSDNDDIDSLGEVLAKQVEWRERIQVVCRFGVKDIHRHRPQVRVRHYDTSLMHIVSSVDRVLTTLNLERLDVFLVHQPDPLMQLDEVAESFAQLKDTGKVRYFGLSNFLPRQMELLTQAIPQPLVTNQFEFSLAVLAPLHNGVLEKCQSLKMSPMAWSPLARGRLFKPEDERFYRIVAAMNTVKKECGAKSKASIALAWLLRHPAHIVPILGSGDIKHLKQAAAAVKFKLSREQWFLLLAASVGRDTA